MMALWRLYTRPAWHTLRHYSSYSIRALSTTHMHRPITSLAFIAAERRAISPIIINNPLFPLSMHTQYYGIRTMMSNATSSSVGSKSSSKSTIESALDEDSINRIYGGSPLLAECSNPRFINARAVSLYHMAMASPYTLPTCDVINAVWEEFVVFVAMSFENPKLRDVDAPKMFSQALKDKLMKSNYMETMNEVMPVLGLDSIDRFFLEMYENKSLFSTYDKTRKNHPNAIKIIERQGELAMWHNVLSKAIGTTSACLPAGTTFENFPQACGTIFMSRIKHDLPDIDEDTLSLMGALCTNGLKLSFVEPYVSSSMLRPSTPLSEIDRSFDLYVIAYEYAKEHRGGDDALPSPSDISQFIAERGLAVGKRHDNRSLSEMTNMIQDMYKRRAEKENQ
eukprot:TRINITY_DN12627_c0_g1_i1.p1 TRINITY_DN12627_c0_g1~~TRINITY_DN12627_c0_g1_i1.p1  ORF type:complete len:395 (-),score=39.62 TRINITY_DN12627_c0_g1_i1:3-1187(-)